MYTRYMSTRKIFTTTYKELKKAGYAKKFITSTTPLLRPSTNSLAPRIANNPFGNYTNNIINFCSSSIGFKICKLCTSIIQLPLSVVTPSRQTGVPPSLTSSRAT